MIEKIINFFKKLLGRKEAGFTLVELLIVIALIGILAGAVIATINPIQQVNKANDAKTQNAAAEVLSALERYYASETRYPWNAIDSTLTINSAFGATSVMAGMGVCTATSATKGYNVCTVDSNNNPTVPGALISSDELKATFMNRNYFKGDATFDEKLYLYKFVSTDATWPNAIFICYIPQAKINRTNNHTQWKITLDSNNAPASLTKAADSDFDSNGDPVSAYDYTTLTKSLLRCMPE